MRAAARLASLVRVALMSQRDSVIVPQSPGVAVAMWICQPASARRTSVPAQRISASSGWARKARAVLVAMERISLLFVSPELGPAVFGKESRAADKSGLRWCDPRQRG